MIEERNTLIHIVYFSWYFELFYAAIEKNLFLSKDNLTRDLM